MPFSHAFKIRFDKTQFYLNGERNYLFAFKICLATIRLRFPVRRELSVGALTPTERRMSNGKKIMLVKFWQKAKGISKEKNQFCLVYYDCVVCRNDGFSLQSTSLDTERVRNSGCITLQLYGRKAILMLSNALISREQLSAIIKMLFKA